MQKESSFNKNEVLQAFYSKKASQIKLQDGGITENIGNILDANDV